MSTALTPSRRLLQALTGVVFTVEAFFGVCYHRRRMNSWFDYPAFRDCRKLFLRNYTFQMYLGAYEHERLQPQRVRMTVELYVSLAASTPQADTLNEVLDYEFIRQCIDQRVKQGHIQLQETLCDDVLVLMLAQPHVRAACVASEKLDAYPNCESVGCEVFGMNP